MTRIRNIALNSISLAIGGIVNRGLELVALYLLTLYISVEDMGTYFSIGAYLSIIGVTIDFGLNIIIRRESARNRVDFQKYIFNGLIISTLLLLLVIIIAKLILLTDIFDFHFKEHFWYAFGIVLFSSRIVCFRKAFEAAFVIAFKAYYLPLINLIDRTLYIIAIVFFISGSKSLKEAFLYIVLAEAISFIVLIGFYIKLFKFPKLKIEFEIIKKLIKDSFPIFATNISVNLISRLGLIILPFSLGTNEEMGYFGIATKITLLLGLISSSIVMPFYQILSEKFSSNRKEFFTIYNHLIKYLLVIIFIAASILFVNINKIILLVFPNYLSAVPYVRILLIGELFVYGMTALTNAVLAANMQVKYSKMIISIALLAVPINIISIQYYSAYGAAVAFIISSALYLIVGYMIKDLKIFILPIYKFYLKPILIVLFVCPLAFYMDLNIIFSSLMIILLFTISFVVFKGFDNGDYQNFRKLTKNNKLISYINYIENKFT